jgi:class 3 adenylate cyclase
MRCVVCGALSREQVRFCANCGTPQDVSRPAGPAEQRRLVSIVFCDLVGSTSLAGRLDPEVLRSVTLGYFDLMRDCVEAHGGVVEKFIGDAVMAAFGIPVLHEDDARRALAAAYDMVAALADFNVELEAGLGIRLDVRIGVNTGEVVTTPDTSAGHGFVSGEAANVAARLEQNAAPGQILVGPQTVRAAGGVAVVEPAGDLVLRGKSQPVTAYVLLGVRSDEPEVVRRFDLPFVGRAPELAELSLVLDRLRRQGEGQLMSVFGDAGIGKTRLVRTWLANVAPGVRSGTGRCRPDGEAGTLAPLAEAITTLMDAGGAGVIPPVLRDGLLRDGAPNPSVAETVAAVSELLAAEAPVVLVLDDCHWAAPALLDVLDDIIDRTDPAPVLFVCLARPELMETRPGWGGGRLNMNSMVLQPLPRPDAERLAAGLVEVGAHGTAPTGQPVAGGCRSVCSRRPGPGASGSTSLVQSQRAWSWSAVTRGIWRAATSPHNGTKPPAIGPHAPSSVRRGHQTRSGRRRAGSAERGCEAGHAGRRDDLRGLLGWPAGPASPVTDFVTSPWLCGSGRPSNHE